MMDGRKETGIAVLAAIIIMVLVGLMALTGCTSKKVVTERVVTHDTLTVTHRDTLWQWRTIVLRDTTHVVTERVVTIKDGGDTLRIVTNNMVVRYVERKDSSDHYRHVADSLNAILDKQKDKEEVRQRVPLIKIAQWLVLSFLVFGIIVVVLKSKSR